MTAHVYFQASLIAEREGHWISARDYAERARALYEGGRGPGRRRTPAEQPRRPQLPPRKPDDAAPLPEGRLQGIDRPRPRRRGRHGRLVARAGPGSARASSTSAEEQARHALTLLGDREDRLDEIGNAQLVLGRSLLEQGRLDEAATAFDEAENTFEKFESTSHRAAVWIAKGDLTARRGTTPAPHGCTGARPKPCRTSGSNERR